MGVKDSCDECGPKRPPRRQKCPGDSGTSKVETGKGRDGSVTSTMKVSWRTSWHSFFKDSETSRTKSRTRPAEFPAQPGTVIPSTGKEVWPPQSGDMSSRPTCGYRRLSTVDAKGSATCGLPFKSLSRSTICSTPLAHVP